MGCLGDVRRRVVGGVHCVGGYSGCSVMFISGLVFG